MKDLDRRDFLKFLGATTLTASQVGFLGSMTACNSDSNKSSSIGAIKPSFEDKLIMAADFKYQTIISWGDKMSANESFGFNNDYIAIEPITSEKLLMWVNHEYTHPVFVGGFERTKKKRCIY